MRNYKFSFDQEGGLRPMLDTGFPRADVENDFMRARRRQVLAALTHRLRRQPRACDRLLPLERAAEGFERIASGQNIGKIVVSTSP